MHAWPDPRPLTGEPISLDLVNTEWVDHGERRDLLSERGGLRMWLESMGLGHARRDEAARAALLQARAALRAVLEHPSDVGARAALNGVLHVGRLRRRLAESGPQDAVEVLDPAWQPAWVAVNDYLELLGRAPDRIRACAHPDCILYFFDTSRRGGRRWCSMASCGNRAKSRRHYERARALADHEATSGR